MTTLLDARLLVLDVDAAGTGIDEELHELHHGGYPAKAGVGVGDAGDQEVDLLGLVSLLAGQVGALIVLLAIVEELRGDQLLHLIRHGAHGVVREVGARLVVVWDVRGRALPPGHIDGCQILAHVRELDDI